MGALCRLVVVDNFIVLFFSLGWGQAGNCDGVVWGVILQASDPGHWIKLG